MDTVDTGLGQYWCDVCGRGVKGYHGKTCLVCIEKGRNEGCGILKTAEESTADRLAFAESVKQIRKSQQVKGQKTFSEQLAEMKENILSDLRKEYDIAPKVKEEVLTKTETKSKK